MYIDRKKAGEFLLAIEKVEREFGLTISHEDCHGGFLIEPLIEYNIFP